jgi:hypothetical protein
MRRESAIADDYWRYIFKQEKTGSMDVVLQNIEHKIDHLAPGILGNSEPASVSYFISCILSTHSSFIL